MTKTKKDEVVGVMRRVIGALWFAVDEVIPDMLRYDLAFTNDRYPHVVAAPLFTQRGHGKWGGEITMARWKSFCVTIAEIDSQIAGVGPNTLADNPEDWYTFRHNRLNQMTHELMKVTLREYLEHAEDREWS